MHVVVAESIGGRPPPVVVRARITAPGICSGRAIHCDLIARQLIGQCRRYRSDKIIRMCYGGAPSAKITASARGVDARARTIGLLKRRSMEGLHKGKRTAPRIGSGAAARCCSDDRSGSESRVQVFLRLAQRNIFTRAVFPRVRGRIGTSLSRLRAYMWVGIASRQS